MRHKIDAPAFWMRRPTFPRPFSNPPFTRSSSAYSKRGRAQSPRPANLAFQLIYPGPPSEKSHPYLIWQACSRPCPASASRTLNFVSFCDVRRGLRLIPSLS
jgi:hypothetical protein